MDRESRRQFLRRTSRWVALPLVGLLSTGCYDEEAARRWRMRRSSSSRRDEIPVESHPGILARTAIHPLSQYLYDIEATAVTFIQPGYFEENGVILATPDRSDFGLGIRQEPSASGINLTVVKASIRAGRQGGQAFAIENRYLQDGIFSQRRIHTGTFDHVFIRTDYIPGQPLGSLPRERLMRESMLDIPQYVFKFNTPVNWSEPEWQEKGGPFEGSVILRGTDVLGRRYTTQSLMRPAAYLTVDV